MGTHVYGNAVIQSLANHRLPLNVYVFPVFDWQSLDVFAVQVKGDRLRLHAEANLVPVAVEEVVDFRILEHSSDGVFRQPNCIVLHGFVLTVQTDGHLEGTGKRR